MKILNLKTINGPNVYHSRPVLSMKVDLESWAETASNTIPQFNQKLLNLLPGLNSHRCSPGVEGGFCTRLEQGTYLAHVIEHVALELSTLSGIEVTFGKARSAGGPGIYHIITRFTNEEGMRCCLIEAFRLVQFLIGEKQEFNLSETIEDIRQISQYHKIGPTTSAIIEAARTKNIPVRRLNRESLFQLGYGKNRKLVQASMTDRTSVVATDLVQNKDSTKSILNNHFVPTPHGVIVYSVEDIEDALTQMKPPLVIKPLDGHHGEGVSLNLHTIEEMKKAFEIAKSFSKRVLLEEMCQGKDYRILVVNYKFCAAAERTPAQVKGDGRSTIQQLIEKENQNPYREEGHSNVLSKIKIDEILIKNLEKQSLQLQTVLPPGETAFLREAANISSGGTATDVTSQVHADIKRICERIARIVNLDICGIDLIHRDISEPVNDFFKVIEVNAAPGLRMHLQPTNGKTQPVGEAIVEMLYPNNSPSRVPLVTVTGTNGKTTVVRLINKIFSMDGSQVGMTTTSGVWIGNQQVAKGDLTGPRSAETVLSDPLVEKAVLEVARGGILRDGLGYDWSDVAVVTNIRNDHLGQDGIEDIDDLIWVKSLVAERVRKNGWVILNADDDAALSLMDHPRITKIPKKYFLYSTNYLNPSLIKHIEKGGHACWSNEGWIYFQRGRFTYRFMPLEEIPFTLQGTVSFQVSNCLAAIAAGLSASVEIDQIKAALQQFNPLQENLGRLSIYQIGKGHVVLDYGHNPDALSALGGFAKQWKGFTKTVILGLPGDRPIALLEESAMQLAAHFDRVILRDDKDLRGRKPGEVPRILQTFINQNFPQIYCTSQLDETEAMNHVLGQIQENDLVVIIYENIETAMKNLRQFDPIPVNHLPPLNRSVKKPTTLSGDSSFVRDLPK